MAADDPDAKDQSNNPLDKYLNGYSKKTRLIAAVSVLGLVLFFVAAFSLPFKDKLYDSLFPKKISKAAQAVFNYKDSFSETQGQNNLTYLACPKEATASGCVEASWDDGKKAYILAADSQFKISKQTIVPGLTNSAAIKYSFKDAGTAKLEGFVKRVAKQTPTPTPTPSSAPTPSVAPPPPPPPETVPDEIERRSTTGVGATNPTLNIAPDTSGTGGIGTTNTLGEATQSAAVSQIPYIFKIRKDGQYILKEFRISSDSESFRADEFGDIPVTPNTTLEFTLDSNGDTTAYEVELNFTITFTPPQLAEKPKEEEKVDVERLSEEANDLTNQLIRSTTPQPGTLRTQAESQSNLIDIAERRKEKMLKLAEASPKEFVSNSILKNVRDTLPAEVANKVEQQKELKGDIEIVHKDNFQDGSYKNYYFLKDNTTSTNYQLYFTETESLETFSNITVNGLALDNKLVVGQPLAKTSDQQGIVRLQSVSQPEIIGSGNIKVAVVLFKFRDSVGEEFTKQAAEGVMLSVKNLLENNSLDKGSGQPRITISSDIIGWYTINTSTNNDCDQKKWSDEADQVALQNGVNLNQYKIRVYIHPLLYRCFGLWGGNSGEYPNSKRNYTRSWLNGLRQTYIIAHELSHNLGVGHAGLIYCGNNGVSRLDKCQIGGSGRSSGYGDFSTLMGGITSVKHNSPHTSAFNWINTSNVKDLTKDQSGIYEIYSLGRFADKPQLIKIKRDRITDNYWDASQQYYYLSYRKNSGNLSEDSFDLGLGDNYQNGVSIHTANSETIVGTNTYLIENPANIENLSTPVLLDGQVVEDRARGISIKQLSHDGEKARVEINFFQPSCYRDKPTLVNVQSDIPWYIHEGYTRGGPREPVTYTFELINSNTTSCSAAIFELSASIPDGWSVSFTPRSVTLQPKAKAKITAVITPSGPSDSRGNSLSLFAKEIASGIGDELKGASTVTHIIVNIPESSKAYSLRQGVNSIGLTIYPFAKNRSFETPAQPLSVDQFLGLTEGKCTQIKYKDAFDTGEDKVLLGNTRLQKGKGYLIDCPGITAGSSITVEIQGPISHEVIVTPGTQYIAIPTFWNQAQSMTVTTLLRDVSVRNELNCSKLEDWNGQSWVTLSNDAQLDDKKAYRLTCPITIQPTIGGTRTNVIIRGKGFGSQAGSVKFDGVEGKVISWSDNQIKVKVPRANLAAGTSIITAVDRTATITTSTGRTLQATDRFTETPFVCTPCVADIDGSGAVNIIDFSNFSGCNNKIVTNNDDNCAYVDINGDGRTSVLDFSCLASPSSFNKLCLIEPQPVIASVSPESTIVNQTVTVTGSNFGSDRGKLTFNYKLVDSSNITSWSDSQIVFKASTQPMSGKVQVYTQDGRASESTQQLSVITPTPTPTSQPTIRTQTVVEPTPTPRPTSTPTSRPTPTSTPLRTPLPTPRPQSLRVSCVASPTVVNVNQPVTWTATASGGTGVYSYTWGGAEVIGGRTGQVVIVNYPNPGRKTAALTVRSGNQTKGVGCLSAVYVNYPRINIFNRLRNFIRR